MRDRGRAGARYAAVCVVDNLANGVGEGQLTVEEFEAGRPGTASGCAAVAAIVPELSQDAAVSLAVTRRALDGERIGLRVEDGAIAESAPASRPAPGDEVIDADGTAIVPGSSTATPTRP